MKWPAERALLADFLREKLTHPQKWQGSDMASGKPTRAAAVLVPIVLRAEGATILLTRRALHLPAHPGQISFPGGAVEAGDADLIETALRETEEEIGLARSAIEIVGELGQYHTASAFCVTPVVGLIEPGFSLKPDPDEVEAVLEIPAAALLDPSRYELRWVERGNLRVRSHFQQYGQHLVWGATAGMLIGFGRLLGMQGEAVLRDDLVYRPGLY